MQGCTILCSNRLHLLCIQHDTNPTNAECWPRSAIVASGLFLYLMITLCYCLFSVPVVMGRPLLRCLGLIGWFSITTFTTLVYLCASGAKRTCGRLCRRNPARRRCNLWTELAVCLAIAAYASACQEVDVFHHNIAMCHRYKNEEWCSVDTSEIVKLNPFKREVCLRLTKNDTTVLEFRLLWERLQLACRKTPVIFTRSTRYGLLDSKRCPHAGSCVGQKCASVNRSTKVPELHKANDYPGVTGCVESCGGPGCDCFYPTSGCLFYRIYLRANDENVYEIYKCNTWEESVQIRVTIIRPQAAPRHQLVEVVPNQPYLLPPLTITLSSLGVPPTPFLDNLFVTDGLRTAIAPRQYDPLYNVRLEKRL
ncbi:hypothetical protein RB195_010472 [Necator americanus]